MYTLIKVAFFLLFAQLCQLSFASEMSILPDADNVILLSGEIKKGDAEKLAKNILLLNHNRLDLFLFLDSPGGNIEESLNIASTVKAFHLNTLVKGSGICASSCFYIFLAGDSHVAIGTENGNMPPAKMGYIGLHRPYLKLDSSKLHDSIGAEAHQHDLMQIIGAYLRYQDIPQRLIDLMMSRPSNDLYWMTMEDITELGNYSPGIEELLISRCGYSRNSTSDKVIECSRTAFPDFIQERLSNRKRILEGWRPWVQVSQTGAAVKYIQNFSDCSECLYGESNSPRR